MPVKVTPILEDYLNISYKMMNDDKQIKFSKWMQTALLPTVLIGLSLMTSPLNYRLLIGAIIISAIWVLLYPKRFDKMIKKKVKRMYEYKIKENPDFLDPYTVSYIENGLKANKNNQEFTALFDNLDLYVEEEDIIYIIGGGFDFILPRRCFKNDQVFEATKKDIDFKIQVALRM